MSLSGEDPPPGSETAVSFAVLTRQQGTRVSLGQALIPLRKTPSPDPGGQRTAHWEIGFNTWIWGGSKHSVYTTLPAGCERATPDQLRAFAEKIEIKVLGGRTNYFLAFLNALFFLFFYFWLPHGIWSSWANCSCTLHHSCHSTGSFNLPRRAGDRTCVLVQQRCHQACCATVGPPRVNSRVLNSGSGPQQLLPPALSLSSLPACPTDLELNWIPPSHEPTPEKESPRV